eukprot:5573103-Amphidinium_carterae.1
MQRSLVPPSYSSSSFWPSSVAALSFASSSLASQRVRTCPSEGGQMAFETPPAHFLHSRFGLRNPFEGSMSVADYFCQDMVQLESSFSWSSG